jgi:hypothetical protein
MLQVNIDMKNFSLILVPYFCDSTGSKIRENLLETFSAFHLDALSSLRSIFW